MGKEDGGGTRPGGRVQSAYTTLADRFRNCSEPHRVKFLRVCVSFVFLRFSAFCFVYFENEPAYVALDLLDSFRFFL